VRSGPEQERTGVLGGTFDRDDAVRRIVASGHRAIAMTLLDQRIDSARGRRRLGRAGRRRCEHEEDHDHDDGPHSAGA